MEWLKMMFEGAESIMKTPMTIWGFTFSWWNVFWWSIVAALLIWFISRVFDD